MQPLYTDNEFEEARSGTLLNLQCESCSHQFSLTKAAIIDRVKRRPFGPRFCGKLCHSLSRVKTHRLVCGTCGIGILIPNYQKKRSKSDLNFCSYSCSATYHNTHKTTGHCRSKLEIWLETQLLSLYPSLHFVFNGKDTINSELDIYLPEIKLAIELNGIYHYEPIHGEKKLISTQNNDQRKFAACSAQNISLVVIDVSSMLNFKARRAQKFLDIIMDIINRELLTTNILSGCEMISPFVETELNIQPTQGM